MRLIVEENMHAVPIPDQIYAQAQNEALASGLSVSAYISGLVAQAAQTDVDNWDHFFTPRVLEELDAIASDLDLGTATYSSEDIDVHLASKRKEWLANRPS